MYQDEQQLTDGLELCLWGQRSTCSHPQHFAGQRKERHSELVECADDTNYDVDGQIEVKAFIANYSKEIDCCGCGA